MISPKTPVFWGGSDAVPSDFSGNVVGGYDFETQKLNNDRFTRRYFFKYRVRSYYAF